jgi:hypothetical protein
MEHDAKFSKAKEAVANAMLNQEIMKDEYVQIHNLERKKIKGNKGETTPAASESLVAAMSAYEKSAQAVDATKLAAMTKLYGNLLSNEARLHWG